MAATEAAALSIQVHPLVVLSLADHYTRVLVQHPRGTPRCMGLLFGQQDGRVVRVLETVELAFTEEVPGEPTIQTEAVENDMKLFSEAYADYECLGWYSSGDKIQPHDYVLHKQMSKYNERPLFLLLDPHALNGRDLPLRVFEESVHVSGDQTSSEFVQTPFVLQADEAERITVTHCAKVVNQEESGSAVTSHYTTLIKSVESLRSRVAALHQFLLDVQAGKVQLQSMGAGEGEGESELQILRDIKALCHRLPIMQQDKFRGELLSEYNDGLLVTYLSSLTKSTQLLADLQDKFNVAHSQPRETSRRGGGGGGGMSLLEEEMMMSGRGRGTPRGQGFMADLMSNMLSMG